MTVGWPVATFLMVIYYLLIKPATKGCRKSYSRKKREEDKMDIQEDGSYTSKSDGLRYSKDGAVLWREYEGYKAKL